MKIRELLDKPEKWTRGVLSAAPSGQVCSPNDLLASKWCLLGAIEKCYNSEPERNEIKNKIRETLKLRVFNINEWNDHVATFDDVQNLITQLNI